MLHLIHQLCVDSLVRCNLTHQVDLRIQINLLLTTVFLGDLLYHKVLTD